MRGEDAGQAEAWRSGPAGDEPARRPRGGREGGARAAGWALAPAGSAAAPRTGPATTTAASGARDRPKHRDPATAKPGAGKAAQALGPVLEVLLQRLGLATQAKRHAVLLRWPQVVGPVIAARARPYRLSGDVLWVAVSHPGWAQELAFLKGKILADLNAATGAPVVRDIRFTAGPRRGGTAGRHQGKPALGGTPAGTRPAGGGAVGLEGPAAGATEAVAMRAAPPAPGGTGAGAPVAAGSGGRASRLEAKPAGLPAGSGGDPDLRAALARWQAAARRRRRWALERGWKPCAGCGTLYPPVPAEDAVSEPSGQAAAGRPEPGPRGAGAPTRLLQPEPPGSGGLQPPAGRRAGLVAGSSASAGQGGLCPACRAAAEEQLRQRVRSLLERDPWLSCLQVAAATGRPPAAVARLYREERATLQDQWRARLRFWAARWRRGDPLPPEARSLLLRYALLRTGREPGELDPTTAREAVGSRLQPLWDACFGPPGAVP